MSTAYGHSSDPVAVAGPRLSVLTQDLRPRAAWRADEDGVPWLCGTRCARCQALAFPARAICHQCAGTDLAPTAIGTAGRLYSWSTVRVSSSRPVPYTLGYVDLAGSVRVLALIEGDPAVRRPDCAVRLVTGDAVADDGAVVGELIFAPAEAGNTA